jgi:hypothetical protein
MYGELAVREFLLWLRMYMESVGEACPELQPIEQEFEALMSAHIDEWSDEDGL